MPSPEVFLPGPFVTTPSSGPAVGNRPGCIPPLQVVRFEQEVLHERGLAQVGFGALFVFSFYTLLSVRLTVSYSRLTKFEPLRLTRPFRAFGGWWVSPRGAASLYPGLYAGAPSELRTGLGWILRLLT